MDTYGPDDPRAFWKLDADHLVTDGQPHDRYVWDCHIRYEAVSEGDEVQAGYQVHDANHLCLGHFHDETLAIIFARTYTLYARGKKALGEVQP